MVTTTTMHPFKEVLIDKELFINIIKNSFTNGNLNNAQMEPLHLLLELQVHSSPGTMKELVLQVTDNSDPLLLLSTIITENGYQNLRSSQGLLVDFNSFPHHFSDLIKRCLEEQQRDSPKFILVLRISGNELPSTNEGVNGKVSLEVLELNSFKHLCHLSLNLTPATVHTKLQHLASSIKTFKMKMSTESDKSKQETIHLREELECLQEKLSVKMKEMECVREEMQRKMSQEVEKHSNIMMQEKELSLKTKSDCDRKLAREKRELETRFHDQISEMKLLNHSLKKSNEELCTKNEWLENAFRDSKQKQKDSEEKSRRQSRDLNSIAKERADLKREQSLKNDSIQQLKAQIAHQEKDIEEMDRIVKRNADRLDILHQEKASLRENLDFSQTKLEKREESLKKLFLDFQKSLEIIKKFKQKIKDDEEEISSLIEATHARKKTLEERERGLKKMKEETEDLGKKLLSRETELDETHKQLKEANEKLLEQESVLKRDENVISWLNKQLNEMETTGLLMRKAPLTEAYINPHTIRSRISASPPAITPSVTTSTPLSAHLDRPSFMNSAQSKMSSVGPPKDIADIPEETSPCTENEKENSPCGLDPKYLERSKKQISLPVRGILRANAVNKHDDKITNRKSQAAQNDKSKSKLTTFGKQSAYFKN